MKGVDLNDRCKKKVEELISRKTELLAETDVYILIGDFISSYINSCKNERNYSELVPWINALNDVTAKLKNLDGELADILKQLKEMG